ncbi:DEKNAAC103851 [Brettanomyces naardenensis]|uniref:DNA helicase n=1 Tax=Brettanomyces naardenensis TaxID=13370 RepID=A0A448YPA6_BRENA|nr:DEKNAAC103851 [Brettanomyces naardenensis]
MAGVFEDSVNYLIDLIISKVVKEKKQDKVGIVTIHDTKTNNPMNDRSSGEWLNCVLDSPKLFNWYSLVELQTSRFHLNKNKPSKDEADLPRSLAITLQNIADINGKKIKKTVKHSIILVTNLLADCSWEGLIEPIISMAVHYDVLLGIVYFPFSLGEDNPLLTKYQDNLDNCIELISNLRSHDGGRVSSSFTSSIDDAKDCVRDFRKDPPKLVSPTSVFKGEIRLCCDLDSIDVQNALADLRNVSDVSEYMPKYKKSVDPFSLSFLADGYPLTKDETIAMTQEIGVKPKDDGHSEIYNLSHIREHYVYEKEKDAEEDNDDTPTKPVRQNEIQKGYRYGSSIVPATTAVERQLELMTYSGIDILSFVRKAEMPPWYYRGESILLLPNKDSSEKDLAAFNLFAQSMLANGTIAIARVVQRPQRPVTLAALIPNIVLTERTKYYVKTEKQSHKRKIDEANEEENKQYYGLSMVRLFFKEDEKIPMLGKLNGIRSNDDLFPTEEMVECMDEFVESMDVDKLNEVEDRNIKEDQYVELNNFDVLPIPFKKGIAQDSGFRSFNEVTRKILSQNSPRIHFILKAMKSLYHYQLEDAKEGDTLFDLVERSKSNPVTEDGRTFFDIFFDELDKITNSGGRNMFIPELYDEVKVGERLEQLNEKMKAMFDVEKIIKEEKVKTAEEDEKQEENLKPVEELLGIGE